MNLHGMAMVRNEADIIEVFVRHNLTVLDHLSVVDHGSADATPSILAALVSEDLPLEVTRETSVEYRQSDVVFREVLRILSTTEADFIILLDADEFLKVPSRSRLEIALSSMPIGMHAVQEWHTYVPDFSRTLDPVALLRSARKVTPTSGWHKAIIARHFLNSPMLIVDGNHFLQKPPDTPGDRSVEHFPLLPEESALAHVPIRSADQFTAKIAVGWLARLAARRNDPTLSPTLAFHWREAYEMLAAGKRFSTDDLIAMAANYSVPRAEWVIPDPATWVDDPFVSAIELRYTKFAQVDALSSVLTFAEELARR
jgi:hypothetical protein